MGSWIFDTQDRKYACFTCRKSFNASPRKCPNCGGEIHMMGTVFKAPKRQDELQWRAIEMLWRGGVRYEHANIAWHDFIMEISFDPAEWSQERLLRVMKTYTEDNPVWQLPLYQFSRPRPVHPRDVPDYLYWWWNNIRDYVAEVNRMCGRFGMSPPIVKEHEEVTGWLKSS